MTQSEPIAAADVSPARSFLVPKQRRRQFLFWFTLLSLIGWVLARSATSQVAGLFSQPGLPPNLSGNEHLAAFVGGAIFGAIVAAAQWFVLRRYLAKSGWWILATSVGWLIFITLSTFFPPPNPLLGAETPFALATRLLIVSGFGVLWIGLAQWQVLRRSARRIWWWVLVPLVANLGAELLMVPIYALAKAGVTHLAQVSSNTTQVVTILVVVLPLIRALLWSLIQAGFFLLCRRKGETVSLEQADIVDLA